MVNQIDFANLPLWETQSNQPTQQLQSFGEISRFWRFEHMVPFLNIGFWSTGKGTIRHSFIFVHMVSWTVVEPLSCCLWWRLDRRFNKIVRHVRPFAIRNWPQQCDTVSGALRSILESKIPGMRCIHVSKLQHEPLSGPQRKELV